jgi:putative DNA primase/helicase
MTLDPRHYAMLHDGSAIADEVIKVRGYRSLAQPDDLVDLGFSKAQAKAAPALGIPLWDVHGQVHGWQIRPDCPRVTKEGKVFKYETPKGGRVRLDIHPSVQELLGNPSIPLWVTEGVRKGDSLASQGACTVALMGGVWGFKGTNEHGGKVILPDWGHVALNGRLVCVAYDSDFATKPGVKAALDALWRFLRDRQAIPARVHWPEEFQQRKWGVDDFLATGHTLDELQAMIPTPGHLPAKTQVLARGNGEHAAKKPRIRFDLTEKEKPRVTLANVLAVLEQHPGWHGTLGFDELLNDAVLHKRPPYLPEAGNWKPRALIEQDYREMATWLQREYSLYASSPLASEGLLTYAFRFPFHALRDYLISLAWDGTHRLDSWLFTYCHTENTPYVRAVGSKTLIAAVARILEPGCKVDTMLILEGPQGAGKSTVWNTLAGDDWFTDWLPDLHEKDAAQTLCGKWFVEFGELSQFKYNEVETVKRFVSAKQDHYRPSYGKRAQTFPRQNIFVGSTNAEHYFKDATGNRRFWPVQLEGMCDVDALRRDRDQLWAEAVVRYRQGEQWYLTGQVEQEARKEQEQRVELDDWEVPVTDYAEHHFHYTHDTALLFVTSREILTEALHLENPMLWTQANTKRIGSILRRYGWKSRPVWNGDNTKQIKAFTMPLFLIWRPPGNPVTGNNEEKCETGNNESPSNDASETCVTGVTGSPIRKMDEPPNKYREVPVTTGKPVIPVTDMSGDIPPNDTHRPCYICHGTVFWQNTAGKPVCGRCHPRPTEVQP